MLREQETVGGHTGVWFTYRELKHRAKVPTSNEEDDTTLSAVSKGDLTEGFPIIIGESVWRIFLYDHVSMRYFVEHWCRTETRIDLLNSFDEIMEEEVNGNKARLSDN